MNTRRRHVVIIAHSPVDRHSRLLRFVHSLAQSGDRVTIAAYSPASSLTDLQSSFSDLRFEELPTEGSIVVTRMRRLLRNLAGFAPGKYLSTLGLFISSSSILKSKIFTQEKFEVVIALHPLALPIASKIAKLQNARLIYDITEAASKEFDYSRTWRWLEQPYISKLEAGLIGDAHGIITSSPEFLRVSMENAAGHLSKQELKNLPAAIVFPNYPNEPAYKPQKLDSGKRPMFLYQGLANQNRHLSQILESIALWKNDAGLILQLVGNQSNRTALIELSEKLQITDRIVFVDPARADKLVESAATSGAIGGFCILNKNHSQTRAALTNKLFTYIRAGLVPLVNAGTLTGDFVAKNKLGPIIRNPNPEEIAAAVNLILDDKNRRENLQNNLFKYAQNISWKSIEDDFLELIHN